MIFIPFFFSFQGYRIRTVVKPLIGEQCKRVNVFFFQYTRFTAHLNGAVRNVPIFTLYIAHGIFFEISFAVYARSNNIENNKTC